MNEMVTPMELRRLKHFDALHRLGSFARAAAEMGITQSALSRSVQKLEDELGTLLFDRNTHHVRATESGERLVRHARDVLAAAAALHEEADALGHPVSGVVRIGCGPYPLLPLVGDAVAAFAATLAGVRINVTTGQTDSLLRGMVNRALDVVVCDMSKFHDSAFADDIAVTPLIQEPLALVCRMGHPAAATKVRDLSQFPWALPPPAPASQQLLAEPLLKRLRAGTFPDYQLDSMEACLNMVRLAGCITVAPMSLALRVCQAGDLVYRRLSSTSKTNDGVHFLRGRTQSPSVRIFIGILSETAKSLKECSDLLPS